MIEFFPYICLMERRHNLQGKRYGRVLVVDFSNVDKGGNSIYNCKCDCGKEFKAAGSNVKRSAGVGCVDCKNKQLKERKTTHGETYTRLYVTWCGMISRCTNPKDLSYKYYGAKGVLVCDEWKTSYEAFSKWAKSSGYSDSLTIDRINPFGIYSPNNCQWKTIEEQQRNRRNTVRYNVDGITRSIGEWCDSLGIPETMVRSRLKRGMDIKEALSTDKMKPWGIIKSNQK
jgi:hypothetical protein